MSAFSLIELIITLVIVALIIGLLVPQYSQMRRKSAIEVAKNQAAAVERNIQAYFGSFATFDEMNQVYEKLKNAQWVGGACPEVADFACKYIDPVFKSSQHSQISIQTSTLLNFATPEMRLITGTFPAGTHVDRTIGGHNFSIPAQEGLKKAYARIYWADDADINIRDSIRRRSFPVVLLFIPTP